MKLPAAAYSAEVATSATKTGSCGVSCEILRSHSPPFAKATEGSPRLHPRNLLRRSSRFGCEGWKLRGIRRRRINFVSIPCRLLKFDVCRRPHHSCNQSAAATTSGSPVLAHENFTRELSFSRAPQSVSRQSSIFSANRFEY